MKKMISFLLFLSVSSLFGQEPTQTTVPVWRPVAGHPDGGHFVRFYDPNNLDQTKRWFAKELNFAALPVPPATWDFGVGITYPMDLNDQYGDCFYAERCHADNTYTGWYGPQSVFSLSAIKTRYLALSGGDNGLSDGDVQREHRDRYIADVPAAKAIDFLYVDVTNPAAIDAAMYWFGGTAFTFTVSPDWISNSDAEFVWEASTYRNNSNGHAVSWNGKNSRGYRLITWGVTGTITPAAVKVCNPDGFVTFSSRMFDPRTGKAMNGKHITELAAMWVSAGGKAIPASVISAFPPLVVPPPPPPGGDSVTIITSISGNVKEVVIPWTFGTGIAWPADTPQWLKDAVIKQKALPPLKDAPPPEKIDPSAKSSLTPDSAKVILAEIQKIGNRLKRLEDTEKPPSVQQNAVPYLSAFEAVRTGTVRTGKYVEYLDSRKHR